MTSPHTPTSSNQEPQTVKPARRHTSRPVWPVLVVSLKVHAGTEQEVEGEDLPDSFKPPIVTTVLNPAGVPRCLLFPVKRPSPRSRRLAWRQSASEVVTGNSRDPQKGGRRSPAAPEPAGVGGRVQQEWISRRLLAAGVLGQWVALAHVRRPSWLNPVPRHQCESPATTAGRGEPAA